MEDQAPRHLAGDGPLADGRRPPTPASMRSPRRVQATRGQGRDLVPVHGVQAPPRRARLQGVRIVVHRRRRVGRQPRQGGRSGRDRGAARPHPRGVRERSGTHLPPRDEPGHRRRRRHGDGARATGASSRAARRTHPVFEMLGRYVDELVRTPEGWKFVAASPTATFPTSHSKASFDTRQDRAVVGDHRGDR